MTTSCFCQPDAPRDSRTGHKRGPPALAQRCCRVGVAEGDLVPQVGAPRETLHFSPWSAALLYQLPQEDEKTAGTRTRWPWGLFPSRLLGHFRSCRTECVFFKYLFHSDQLKEIKLRRPPLTNSDLQVGGQGECHPGCCPVAMEPRTATGLRRARTLCRARPPASPPACLTEGHRGTQSQDSPVVFLMESNPRGLYIFSFNLGHFVSLSENIT